MVTCSGTQALLAGWLVDKASTAVQSSLPRGLHHYNVATIHFAAVEPDAHVWVRRDRNHGPPDWLRKYRGEDLKGLDLWDAVYATAGNKYLDDPRHVQPPVSARGNDSPPVQPYMVKSKPKKRYLAVPRGKARQPVAVTHVDVASAAADLSPTRSLLGRSAEWDHGRMEASGGILLMMTSPVVAASPVFDDSVGTAAVSARASAPTTAVDVTPIHKPPVVPRLQLSTLQPYPAGSVYSFTPTPTPTPTLTQLSPVPSHAASDVSPDAVSAPGDWDGTNSHVSSEPGSRVRASRELDAALQYLKDTAMSPFDDGTSDVPRQRMYVAAPCCMWQRYPL